MIVFRHADHRFPFLWEDAAQPPARWHGEGEGPVHYFADTPDGAWAEFLRHEEITEAEDLAGVARSLWAVELPDPPDAAAPEDAEAGDTGLPAAVLTGGLDSYPACRLAARHLRAAGKTFLRVPSAALLPDGAAGWVVDGGLSPGPPRDGVVLVLFGPRPDLVGWRAVDRGAPPADLVGRVRPLG